MMKTMLTFVLAVALSAVTLFTTALAVDANGQTQKKFVDVPANHWAKVDIDWAVQEGVVDGYIDNTFKPNQEVTKAEYIKMLVDALQIPHSKGSKPWYQTFVYAAMEEGFLLESDFIDYTDTISRIEMVRLAIRSLDTENVSKSDAELMYEAVESGILHGVEYGRLNPEGTSSRAQAVAIIKRTMDVRKGVQLLIDERALSYAAVNLKGTNIEEVWGIDPIELPRKIDVGTTADVTLNKMVIVDMDSDPKSGAFRDDYPEVAFGYEPLQGGWVIALHFTMENKTTNGTGFWGLAQGNLTADPYDTGIKKVTVPIEYEDSKYHPLVALNLAKDEKSEGWYLLHVSKEDFEKNELARKLALWNNVYSEWLYLLESE